MKYKRNIIFFNTLFQQQTIPNCYTLCALRQDPLRLIYTSNNIPKDNIFSINLIPGYLELESSANLTKKVVSQENKGYAVDCTQNKNIDNYLKNQFSKNDAKNIKKRVRRLESCFTVRYEFIQKDLSLDDYRSLMNQLKEMIVKRFQQREEDNTLLENWDNLTEKNWFLFLKGKLSIFVIYHAVTPIQISLLYHYDRMLLSAVSSYNVAYSKFGLGNIAILKQLEWCFINNYIIFEQGYGDLDYKRKWSNLIYQFEHHILYKKNSIVSFFIGYLEFKKIQLKELLKVYRVNILLKNIKVFFKAITKKTVVVDNKALLPYIILEESPIEISPDEIEIDIKNNLDERLLKPICDFLFLTSEDFNELKVYGNSSNSKISLIGKNNKQIISFQSQSYKNKSLIASFL